MTKTEAFQCLSVLKASYPRQQLEVETLQVYANALADFEAPEVNQAIMRIIRTSKWFPTVAEICDEIANVAIADLSDPENAWGEVRRAIGKFGRNREPEFSSPEIAAAVSDIGWQTICNDENVSTTRANFREAYRAYHSGVKTAAKLGEHAIKPDNRLRAGSGMQRLDAKVRAG